jgi:hypothetical protein
MKKRFCIASLFLLCLTSPWIAVAQTVILENPVRMVTSSDRSIFPESWLSPDINAEAEMLQESQIDRSRIVLYKAMKNYPGRVLARNLETIYVLHRLKYKGISAGGTNSRRSVYVANRGNREGFTDIWIERTFHAEFSSILLRNFPQYLDKDAWKKANVESFKYGVSGVQAVKQEKDRTVFDPSLHAEGFLYEYAKSTLENDFNSIAEHLFLGDGRFWSVVNKHQKIKEKTDPAIAFYHQMRIPVKVGQ